MLQMLTPTTERITHELIMLLAKADNLMVVEGLTARAVADICTKVDAIIGHVHDDRLRFRARHMLRTFNGASGRTQQAYKHAEELLRLARQLGEPMLLMSAHQACGVVLLQLGNFRLSKEHFTEAEAISRRSFDADVSTWTVSESVVIPSFLAAFAVTLWMLGYPDQARAKINEALKLADNFANPRTGMVVYFYATLIYRHMRAPQRISELVERMQVMDAQYDIRLNQLEKFGLQGWLQVNQGFNEGIAEMRAGIDGFKAINHTMFQTHRLGLLAEAQQKMGQLQAASATLEEAFAMAEQSGQRSWDADLHRLKGDLLCAAGGSDQEALLCYEQALVIARQQSAKSLELRATLRLSQLLQRQGNYDEACQRLKEIYGWFSEGLDTSDLLEAQTLLSELCA
jgi:adenylate cyclase